MIYLDNNATTRVDERVLQKALPFLTEQYANASSTHGPGLAASDAVKTARKQVAALLHAEPFEIVFTSGATEALNLAIKGVAAAHHGKTHLVAVVTEHPAVLDTCRFMENQGYDVTYLPVQPDGLLDLATLKAALKPGQTLLVAVMLANNETGVIQPVAEIAELAHEAGALMLTDATQAVGKIPVDVRALGVDLLALSGHKFHAPKGTGALYVRARTRIQPHTHGGGHERGLRSGTLNTFGIVALGEACALAAETLPRYATEVAALRDVLENTLLQELPGVERNGHPTLRLPNTANLYFPGADSDAMQIAMRDIAVSNGSACSSAKIEPSHVLTAMGRTEEQAFQCLRFSLSRETTRGEMEEATQEFSNRYIILNKYFLNAISSCQ